MEKVAHLIKLSDFMKNNIFKLLYSKNYSFYKHLYEDLAHLSNDGLINHYIRNGFSESRMIRPWHAVMMAIPNKEKRKSFFRGILVIHINNANTFLLPNKNIVSSIGILSALLFRASREKKLFFKIGTCKVSNSDLNYVFFYFFREGAIKYKLIHDSSNLEILSNEVFNGSDFYEFDPKGFLIRSALNIATEKQKDSLSYFSKVNNLRLENYLRPIAMLVSFRSYPYGGGEEFLLESGVKLTEIGYKVIWVTFRDKNFELHKTSKVRVLKNLVVLDIADIDTDLKVANAIDELSNLLVPDLIHVQGEINSMMHLVKTCTPILMGYHFWNGLINFSKNINGASNIKMLQNIKDLKISPVYFKSNKSNITKYIVSEFMSDVLARLGLADIPKVIPPVFAEEKRQDLGFKRPLLMDGLILQVNCSVLKGGEIFYACSSKIPGHKFLGFVPTNSEYTELSSKLNVSKNKLKAQGILNEYRENIGSLYKEAKLLLIPTKVDETFSRVVHEAVQSGVPVLSTGNGNIKYLLGGHGLVNSEDPEVWTGVVSKLLKNPKAMSDLATKQRHHLLKELNFTGTEFIDLANRAIKGSKKYNIGFFAPWGDQGLGTHVKLYVDGLRRSGIGVHVFSHQSYLTIDKSIKFQSNPEEWENVNSVHYSLNTRENVTLHELSQFVRLNNIGIMVFPEVCWAINWERLHSISKIVEVVLIPNPETLRRGELEHHNAASRILHTTEHSLNIFEKYFKKNKSRYIGHGFGSKIPTNLMKTKCEALKSKSTLNFLHIGGYNLKRKNTLKIIKIFNQAIKFRSDIYLNVFIQPNSENFQEVIDFPCSDQIRINIGNFSSKEILTAYLSNDVSIQVSSHEGLGMGFYESISSLVPVISLDTPPHNEPVREGVTGWLIKPDDNFCLYDNDEALVEGSSFESLDLLNLFLEIQPQDIIKMLPKLREFFNRNYTEEILMKKFLAGLYGV